MRKALMRVGLAALITASWSAAPALAGGSLETVDITGFHPSPIPGHVIGKVVPEKWDSRCIPVLLRVNGSLDPIPNPLGPATLSVATAKATLQSSLNEWNNIPTSFIDFRIVGNTGNPGIAGFDFVNELTFRAPASAGYIALTPSVTLVADSVLAAGDDIDGDGDSDVATGIATCTDVDGDGDVEFPAGTYKAGTILDSDILFNTNVYRFTTTDAAIDTNSRSVDLKAIAVHEAGHLHGLAHAFENNLAANDGTASTMFPFINTEEPASEIAQRSPESDDIAWLYLYPEGTATSGPAALRAGDIPFNLAYGVISGTATHGVFNEPLAGADVFARNVLTGRIQGATYSGTTQLSVDGAGNQYALAPSFNIVDGKYTLPVLIGLYEVGIAAVDGDPIAGFNVNNTTSLGQFFGQQDFNEEFWNGNQEAAVEANPGAALPVVVLPGQNRSGVDFVTNDQNTLRNFGSLDFIGFNPVAAGSYYAVRFPGSQILATNPGGDVLIQEGLFRTILIDSSVVPIFAEAILAPGSASGSTVNIDIAHPLWRDHSFLGRDNDEAPFFFPAPRALGQVFKAGVNAGRFQDLFLVLRLPTGTPFPGIHGLPLFVGLDGGVVGNDAPIFGLSYFSANGSSWTQITNVNFMFSLVLSKPAP